MTSLLVVHINGESQLEYDRNKPLGETQLAYLDKIDQDMNTQGITLENKLIREPSMEEKSQYVAMIMAKAIIDGNEATSAATCSYLASRLPDLKQVKIIEKDQELAFDLIFDKAYVPESIVSFVSPSEYKKDNN